jgi:hypothetical protein
MKVALICLLISRPLIVVQDKLKEHFPEPTKVVDDKIEQDDTKKSGKNESPRRKVNETLQPHLCEARGRPARGRAQLIRAGPRELAGGPPPAPTG